jgi:glucose repression regulatory protein TUP1
MVPAGSRTPVKASHPPPPPPPPQQQQQQQQQQPGAGLADVDPDNVPANMKVEGQDWFAL